MSRFTLEVVQPQSGVPLDSDEEPLESALDAVATVHGGMVVGSPANTGKSSARHYVNIFDCEDSLEDEVQWLRKRFPHVRFTLKEFM
jgi:hypothetical protein